jgi:3-mercaptopyruvate sulfurtransferase SseA
MSISTTELAQQLEHPALALVDVRPMAAYNGWPLNGEARGGHIPGAVPFPLAWADAKEPTGLKSLLAAKGLTADRTSVVYGYTYADSAAMIARLRDLGYTDVRAYEAGLGEWAADDSLPLARLANYEKLVYAEWLHRAIKERRGQEKLQIFHVDFGVPEEFGQGHIPGAVHLDTHALEAAPTWNRRPDAELEAALLALGITHATTVVLYGSDTAPGAGATQPGRNAGQIAAARAAVILMYAGVEDVRLLDGGFDAWVAAGYEIETGPQRPTPAKSFGVPLPGHPEVFVDIQAAKALLAAPDGVLASIRSWPEFIGATSGYSYIAPRGRIAGAVWGNAGSDAQHRGPFRNLDNTLRDYHEIEAHWRSVGITPDKRVAFYCGTGWRASEAFFCAHLMGWEHIAIYDGGWLEWSRDTSNPIESGPPPPQCS